MAKENNYCDKNNHCFEARYDFKFPIQNINMRGTSCDKNTINIAYSDDSMNRIYVKDVCKYCGKSVERNK